MQVLARMMVYEKNISTSTTHGNKTSNPQKTFEGHFQIKYSCNHNKAVRKATEHLNTCLAYCDIN